MLRIRTILVPTDFSESAEQALHVALSLARDHGAKLVLLTSPPPQPQPPPAFDGYLPDPDDVLRVDVARQRLDALAKTITQIPVETKFVIGAAGWSIVGAAEDCQADLIVMGTHGRSGVSRLLLGSIAEYVLRHAPCPVLTIKPTTADHLRHEEETALAACPSSSST